MKCAHCQWKYPNALLNTIYVNGNEMPLICGICALEIINSVHKQKREFFLAPMAEAMRAAAIKWRKEHSNDSPAYTEYSENFPHAGDPRD